MPLWHMDKMKDRIQQIIDREGITPSRFAEIIGIQRSAMSHILSGRNNPSLDVLTKVLQKFDYINTDWLLFGKGNMLKVERSSQHTSLLDENAVFPSIVQGDPEYSNLEELRKPSLQMQPVVKERIVLKETPQKIVSKILIFYSDNTYDTFVPERKEDVSGEL